MRGGEWKGRYRMVETDGVPSFIVVATFALLFRIILRVDCIQVDVLMAIDAAGSDVAEAPSLRFLMAGKAGGGKVCSL